MSGACVFFGNKDQQKEGSEYEVCYEVSMKYEEGYVCF